MVGDHRGSKCKQANRSREIAQPRIDHPLFAVMCRLRRFSWKAIKASLAVVPSVLFLPPCATLVPDRKETFDARL
jgi:hypothetical protein